MDISSDRHNIKKLIKKLILTKFSKSRTDFLRIKEEKRKVLMVRSTASTSGGVGIAGTLVRFDARVYEGGDPTLIAERVESVFSPRHPDVDPADWGWRDVKRSIKLEPLRQVGIKRPFGTLPAEITNAQVDRIIEYMGPNRKFGIFAYGRRDSDGTFRVVLKSTSPDTDLAHFQDLDYRLYGPELGIGSRAEQERFFNGLKIYTHPAELIPDKTRYVYNEEHSESEEERLTFRDLLLALSTNDVAATLMSAFQMKALSMFAAGAFGLSGTSELMSSDQFDALVEGSKYMTCCGFLNDRQEKPLRAYGLKKIVPASNFPPLRNGILPNTVWSFTDTHPTNQTFLLRGGSYSEIEIDGELWPLHAARRLETKPEDAYSAFVVGFRVVFDSPG